MTRSYALRRLLEHGELTIREIIQITRWPARQARRVVKHLQEVRVVELVADRPWCKYRLAGVKQCR